MPATSLEQIISLCKRRGFIFPGSEIYGGLQGTYDYGPLGVELKNNLKRLWWKHNVYERDDMEGIETALLTNRYVLRYSGHEKGFTDPLIDNKTTKKRYRFDHLLKEQKPEVLAAVALNFEKFRHDTFSALYSFTSPMSGTIHTSASPVEEVSDTAWKIVHEAIPDGILEAFLTASNRALNTISNQNIIELSIIHILNHIKNSLESTPIRSHEKIPSTHEKFNSIVDSVKNKENIHEILSKNLDFIKNSAPYNSSINLSTVDRKFIDNLVQNKKKLEDAIYQTFMTTQMDMDLFVDALLQDPAKAQEALKAAKVVDALDGKPGDWTEPRTFNLMFKTQVGPVADDENFAYLRPETAQGMFVNFKNVLDSTNRKLPFGIAQQGKSFRNEITPRNFLFRVRELEQMEIEYFCKPADAPQLHEEWIKDHIDWWVNEVGLDRDKIQLFEHIKLAHYSDRTVDILYNFPTLGFDELEGIANRADFDLGSHSRANDTLGLTSNVAPNEHSVEKLTYFDHETNKHLVPFVIEPAAGVDRGVLAALCEAYDEEVVNAEKNDIRVVLRLKPALAPIKVAVLPLAKNKPEIVAKAKAIKKQLQNELGMRVVYDDTAAIGKLYRRQDEAGTPFCITVDYDTLGQSRDGGTELLDTVTIRDRDTMAQERIAIADLLGYLRARLQ